MNSPMLKRRLNPFLLASTVLVLSLLAGLAVTWQGQLSELVNEKKNLSTEIQDKNQKIDELQSEVSNLTDESSTLQETVDQLKSLNSELNATIRQKEAKIVSLETTIDEKETTISNLESTNQDLEENISDTRDGFLTVCVAEEESGNITDTSEDLCAEHFGDSYE